ncbi:MAG: leucyl/phenylalanyl-tRNA--protein transferase [Pyrinomonadaceae bacterium]|nr:leucyl/phenylalanyl-tRNA--protein transferase [Pyrinomonadaceae bacterium]
MSSIPDPQNHVFAEWVLFGNFYYQARDIIGFGWELNVENVRDAYKKGVFPWHIDGMPLPWFCPEERAVLFFDDLHVARSLQKERRRSRFLFTIDRDFQGVVENCRTVPRAGQHGTWITDEYIEVYTELHKQGDVHSVEVWLDEELVGGLYGVDAGGLFCGESMFFKEPNASKLALLHLIDYLKKRGSDWIDIQVLTEHMEKFGAIEIPRDEFLQRLESTQRKQPNLFG